MNKAITLNDIAQRTSAAKNIANNKVREIRDITSNLRILALNALIEAKRAGDAGRGFSVVAEEVKSISGQVEVLSQTLSSQLGNEIGQLEDLAIEMADQSKGNRFKDLALNAVELIDRNLYERTCDVRWWATDSAIVNAAKSFDEKDCTYASKRLGVILDAYTVYLDLWLCDLNGNIIANGRPHKYNIKGKSCAGARWFKNALTTKSGNDYVVGDVKTEEYLNGAQTITYATGVREDGDENGRLIGVLAINFDWKPQADAIVKGVRLTEEEAKTTDVMLVDSHSMIIASTNSSEVLNTKFIIKNKELEEGYYTESGKTIAFHLTPGYETYEGLGWYGVITSSD